MSVEIVPFPIRVLPCPSGNEVAWLVAWHGPSHGLSVVMNHGEAGENRIASFDTLSPVSMGWSPSGRFLAFAQSEVIQIKEEKRIVSRNLPGPVRKLSWDTNSTLWGISGDCMWQASIEKEFVPKIVLDQVVSICTAPSTAAVRRCPDKLEIVCFNGGERRKFAWPLTTSLNPEVHATIDGSGLFLYAEKGAGAARCYSEFAYLDLESGEPLPMFSGEMAKALGFPTVIWSPWKKRSLLLACELDEQVRVYELDAGDGKGPVPLSPKRFEVSTFAPSVRSNCVAILGTPLTEDVCGTENWLILHDGNKREDPQPTIIQRGVNRLPAWDHAGNRLFYLHASGTSTSQSCIYQPAGDDCRVPYHELEILPERKRTRYLHTLELKKTVGRHAALIHLQGPHRRFLNGPQTTFFHHALFALLEELAVAGCFVTCLNGPGSTGKGRAYREGPASWLEETLMALTLQTKALRASGFERIAVVAGSLGALPALHFLANFTYAAGVFISPVYHPGIPALEDWQHLFGDATNLPGAEPLAQKIRTPLLILHGLCDEMSPAEQSSRFVSNLMPKLPCSYITFCDEEHIFRQPASWESGLSAALDFLKQQLGIPNISCKQNAAR